MKLTRQFAPLLSLFLLVVCTLAAGVALRGAAADVVTIIEPTAAIQQKTACNKYMRKGASVVLPTDQKIALVLVRLNAQVLQSDYPALKQNLENIAGIQRVHLMIDGKTPAMVPDGTRLRVFATCHMRIEDVPKVP